MSWELVILIASIIPAVALWTLTKTKSTRLPDGVKPLSALPGPPALPLVGNLTQLLGYKRPQTHIVWTKVKMPGQTFVVVADPTLLPAVLGRPGLPKSRVYELGFFLATKTFHDTMFSIRHTSNPMWKATRKTLAQAFTSEAIRGFTNPLRKLYRQIFPRSYLAQEFSSRLDSLHSLWHKIMMDVQARGEVMGDDTSLWGCLSRVTDVKTGKPLSGDLLQAEVAGIILGGLDTTAQTCAFTLALLAAHPEKADILAAELDRAELLVTPQRPEPRGMIFSDLASLTYLDGVLKESLRMFPVAATGLSRCTDEDCVLGGYHIPAGTEIQASSNYPAALISTSASDSANKKSTGGQVDRGERHPNAQTFIPFSSGPRDCLGQRLAMMEAATIVGTLLGRFTVELADRMDGYGAWVHPSRSRPPPLRDRAPLQPALLAAPDAEAAGAQAAAPTQRQRLAAAPKH
ncbi:hypothetical protein CVIRNUC_009896 [Coccomyxa viridis]|uniref:Cytochrome P450 n=1 Tax=Coccomyxa viridis TaxID=1274662 RepID=A0AAV1IJ25_9CHLO|nr:hypothetical protein CVIRNUC_009896 [Coccomyxa viridis]